MFRTREKKQENEFDEVTVDPTKDALQRRVSLRHAIIAVPFVMLVIYMVLTNIGFLPSTGGNPGRNRWENQRDHRPKAAVVMSNQQTGQTIANQITIKTNQQIVGEYWTDCDLLDTAIVFGAPFVAILVGEETPPWGFGELCIEQLKSRPQNEGVPIVCVTVNQIPKRSAFGDACSIVITETQMATGKFSPGMFR